MTLLQALQSQGVGSRKQCLALIERGHALVDGVPCLLPKQQVVPEQVCFISMMNFVFGKIVLSL